MRFNYILNHRSNKFSHSYVVTTNNSTLIVCRKSINYSPMSWAIVFGGEGHQHAYMHNVLLLPYVIINEHFGTPVVGLKVYNITIRSSLNLRCYSEDR